MIKKITIKNFRSIKYMTIHFNRDKDGKFFLKLVGGNESGKSSILDAIYSISFKERNDSHSFFAGQEIEKDFEIKILVETNEEVIKELDAQCREFIEKKGIELLFAQERNSQFISREIIHNSEICSRCTNRINDSTILKHNFNSVFSSKLFKFDSNENWKIFLNNDKYITKENLLKYVTLENGVSFPDNIDFKKHPIIENKTKQEIEEKINSNFSENEFSFSFEIFQGEIDDFWLEQKEMSDGINNFVYLILFLEEVKKISQNSDNNSRNLVLLDEPELNLDWKLQKQLYKKLKEYNKFFDIITVSHNVKLLNLDENINNISIVSYDQKKKTTLKRRFDIPTENIKGEFLSAVLFMGIDIYKENFRERRRVVFVENHKMVVLLKFLFYFYHVKIENISEKISFFSFDEKNYEKLKELYLNEKEECVYFLIKKQKKFIVDKTPDVNKEKLEKDEEDELHDAIKKIEIDFGVSDINFNEYQKKLEEKKSILENINTETEKRIKKVVLFIIKELERRKW